MNFKDLSGQKFGRLTAVEHIGSDTQHQALWLCICDCGKEHITTGHSLLRGNCKSCGCLKNELSSERLKKHGGCGSRLYRIYDAMKQRCYNENHNHYKNYGGRGIVVCDEWKSSFDAFQQWAMQNGYADNLTIDRINVDGNYEPQNCRWITMFEQQQNRTNTHIVEYKGEKFTISQLARKHNLKPNVLERRIKNGWDIETAVTRPVRKLNRLI
jgi:hypothetical protein